MKVTPPTSGFAGLRSALAGFQVKTSQGTAGTTGPDTFGVQESAASVDAAVPSSLGSALLTSATVLRRGSIVSGFTQVLRSVADAETNLTASINALREDPGTEAYLHGVITQTNDSLDLALQATDFPGFLKPLFVAFGELDGLLYAVASIFTAHPTLNAFLKRDKVSMLSALGNIDEICFEMSLLPFSKVRSGSQNNILDQAVQRLRVLFNLRQEEGVKIATPKTQSSNDPLTDEQAEFFQTIYNQLKEEIPGFEKYMIYFMALSGMGSTKYVDAAVEHFHKVDVSGLNLPQKLLRFYSTADSAVSSTAWLSADADFRQVLHIVWALENICNPGQFSQGETNPMALQALLELKEIFGPESAKAIFDIMWAQNLIKTFGTVPFLDIAEGAEKKRYYNFDHNIVVNGGKFKILMEMRDFAHDLIDGKADVDATWDRYIDFVATIVGFESKDPSTSRALARIAMLTSSANPSGKRWEAKFAALNSSDQEVLKDVLGGVNKVHLLPYLAPAEFNATRVTLKQSNPNLTEDEIDDLILELIIKMSRVGGSVIHTGSYEDGDVVQIKAVGVAKDITVDHIRNRDLTFQYFDGEGFVYQWA